MISHGKCECLHFNMHSQQVSADIKRHIFIDHVGLSKNRVPPQVCLVSLLRIVHTGWLVGTTFMENPVTTTFFLDVCLSPSLSSHCHQVTDVLRATTRIEYNSTRAHRLTLYMCIYLWRHWSIPTMLPYNFNGEIH